MPIAKTFEHKGRALQLASYDAPDRAAPKKSSSLHVPGAGKFQIEQVSFSEDFTLTAQISGKNIAYLFAEILMKDESGFYGPVLRQYIPADADKETSGVKRPDWSDTINISLSLRPRLTLLTDGVASAFAFCLPEGYRASGCRLNGQYTSAESQTRARLTFDDSGNITEIIAFKGQGMKSTPHALTPKSGDTFAPFVQVYKEEDGASLRETETALSTALTFGEQPFRLETEDPIHGEYLAGILVQDLDGGLTRKYVPFTMGG
jgi:hypothetical protein